MKGRAHCQGVITWDRDDLALIGFGGVNRALAELIVRRGDDLAPELEFTLRVALAGTSGAVNTVAFSTDHLRTVTVSGPGTGRIETAYALLSDIIAIHDRHHANGSAANAQQVLQEAARD